MAGKRQLPPVDIAPVEPVKSRLERLRDMRRVLESHIHSEYTLARDLSPMIRQAREIGKEIADLEADEAAEVEVSVFDGDSTGDAPFRLEAI